MIKLVGNGVRRSAQLQKIEYSEWYEGYAMTPTTMDNGETIWLKNYYWRVCELEHMGGGFHSYEEKCATLFDILQK